ncbi:TIM barrel protein [Nakamurella sp. YIM 132087]|uniref:TIM barrel protein n=1 Tax=Nakamurella alba TaxID=2665158 RepID=A0A7K1FQ18_9ACTN|nr:TIM barrel protein [Nakamurella alba]
MGNSIATVCLSGDLGERLDAAAAAGFEAIELFEHDLTTSDLTPEEVRRRCAALGLRIEMLQPFRDLDSTSPERFARNLRRADGKFALMERLGIDMLLVVSSVAEDAVADTGLLAEQLAVLGSRAAGCGLRIAYEALAWGRHVNTWEASWEAVRRSDHPAVGLCVDSYHVLAVDGNPDGIAGVPAAKLFSVQLADAPRLPMHVLQLSRHHRVFPGQGALDVPRFVDAVRRSGFRGPLSLEVFNDDFRAGDPRATASAGRRSLDLLRAGGLQGRGETRWSRVQLTGAPGALADVDHTLAGLGFVDAGGRSRRHGDAVVVLEPGEGPARIARTVLHDSAGIRSRTPGPDGTELVVEPLTAPAAPSGRWSIDHVALQVPTGRLAECELAHRTAGFVPQRAEEIGTPAGLLRRQPLATHDRGARVLLSSLLVTGPAAVATPQQTVAFGCTDVLGAARAARAAGVPVLPVPANYYEDLACRTELPPALISVLREFDVLYDLSDGGALLRFGTIAFGAVGFELVQRVGAEDGYGELSAPVRIAALHRRQRADLRRATA